MILYVILLSNFAGNHANGKDQARPDIEADPTVARPAPAT
jgi:hypothetical protein